MQEVRELDLSHLEEVCSVQRELLRQEQEARVAGQGEWAGGSSEREQGAARMGFEGQFGALTFTPSGMGNYRVGHGLTGLQGWLWPQG